MTTTPRTGNEIRADYTDEDWTYCRTIGMWDIPDTRDDFVLAYSYPSRFHDEYTALDGHPNSLSAYREGDLFRRTVLRREDRGDGSHVVYYLFERCLNAEINGVREPFVKVGYPA